MRRLPRLVAAIPVVVCLTWIAAGAQPRFDDGDAVTQFQRAVDAYAFQHRQVQRRVGETADRAAMAAAMRSARPAAEDGAIFSPLVAAAFRARLAAAVRAAGCGAPARSTSSVVPRPNQDAGGAVPLAACVTAMLPRLPPELEYRAAGVSLVLVDIHANLVVDVLHAAFP